MRSHVIFLDFDGVVAPIPDAYQYGDLDPACIRVLNEIVARCEADIVVTSSHRYGRSVAELQRMLEMHGFVGRVIDKTPTAPQGMTRGEEIAAWLADSPATAWVILDDHHDMGSLADTLVQTNPSLGLQTEDVGRALAKLAASRAMRQR